MCHISNSHLRQLEPKKVCSRIGLCSHNDSWPSRWRCPTTDHSFLPSSDVSFCAQMQNRANCSKIIKEVVQSESARESKVGEDLFCSACETAALWIHTKLLQNNTKERIFEYINKVRTISSLGFWYQFCLSHKSWMITNVFTRVPVVRALAKSDKTSSCQLRQHSNHAACFLHHRKQIFQIESQTGKGLEESSN